MRRMRLAFVRSTAPTPATPAAPNSIRCRKRVPTTNIITPPTTHTTIVEPKSGSRTSRPASTLSPAAGMSAPFTNCRTRHPMRSIHSAISTTVAIFANSLGCMRSGPRLSQR